MYKLLHVHLIDYNQQWIRPYFVYEDALVLVSSAIEWHQYSIIRNIASDWLDKTRGPLLHARKLCSAVYLNIVAETGTWFLDFGHLT